MVMHDLNVALVAACRFEALFRPPLEAARKEYAAALAAVEEIEATLPRRPDGCIIPTPEWVEAIRRLDEAAGNVVAADDRRYEAALRSEEAARRVRACPEAYSQHWEDWWYED